MQNFGVNLGVDSDAESKNCDKRDHRAGIVHHYKHGRYKQARASFGQSMSYQLLPATIFGLQGRF